jgi:hypothetical protein
MRAGLYARVSTHDRQTLGLQSEAMTTSIGNRGRVAARRIEGVLPAGEQKLIPALPAREIGMRASKNSRWRQANAV